MILAVSNWPILSTRADDLNLLKSRTLVPKEADLLDFMSIELNDVNLLEVRSQRNCQVVQLTIGKVIN